MRTVPRPSGVRWTVFTLLLALGGGLGSLGGLGRADLARVDAVRFFDVAAPRDDIVAISIDDASLAALGPLPWHARPVRRRSR